MAVVGSTFQFFPSCFRCVFNRGLHIIRLSILSQLLPFRGGVVGAPAKDFQFFPSCFRGSAAWRRRQPTRLSILSQLLHLVQAVCVGRLGPEVLSILSQLLLEKGKTEGWCPYYAPFNSFPVASSVAVTGPVGMPVTFNSFPVASAAWSGVKRRPARIGFSFKFFPSCFVRKKWGEEYYK